MRSGSVFDGKMIDCRPESECAFVFRHLVVSLSYPVRTYFMCGFAVSLMCDPFW